MKKKMLIICGIVVIMILAGVVWWNVPTSLVAERHVDDVTKITVFNGNIGEQIEVIEEGYVENLYKQLCALKVKKSELANKIGYGYRITVYKGDKALYEFIMNSGDSARDGIVFYEVLEGGDFYKSLRGMFEKTLISTEEKYGHTLKTYQSKDGEEFTYDEGGNLVHYVDMRSFSEANEDVILSQAEINKIANEWFATITDGEEYTLYETNYVESTGIYNLNYSNYIHGIMSYDYIKVSFHSDGTLFSYSIGSMAYDETIDEKEVPVVEEDYIEKEVKKQMQEEGIESTDYHETGRAYLKDGNGKWYLCVGIEEDHVDGVVYVELQ